MPNDESLIQKLKILCDQEALKLSSINSNWRKVPVNNNCLGPLAKANAPFIMQWIVSFEKNPNSDFEFLLFHLRKRIEKKVRESFNFSSDFYFASFSSKTVVYKGMVRSEVLSKFYKDLKNEDFKVSFSVYHRRFSTNTLPKWPLAQPMRFLGHNGEINIRSGQPITDSLLKLVPEAFRDQPELDNREAVSYTHLTLPTR